MATLARRSHQRIDYMVHHPFHRHARAQPERIEEAQSKFRRYTLGKWVPSSKAFVLRLGLMDYVGSLLLLGRAYNLLDPSHVDVD